MSLMTDENIIDQKAVGDLLSGYHFYIPPYQRGYRWTKQQVIDLCNDLLEYALRPRPEGTAQKSFYSLQPLVVKYRDEKSFDVIDGQQRLTTIYILFRFLMAELAPTPERWQRLLNNEMKLYSINYETRKVDTEFIADLGLDGWEERFRKRIIDIDMAHIHNAYQYMREWLHPNDDNLKDSSVDICRRLLKEDMDPDEIARKLFTLLKNKKDTKKDEGNAQFIWYQLSPDKDAIEEFIVENKGKIGLTDTERIRALFLYRDEKNDEVDTAQQISIAKDWDEIETTLHDPDFWSFISRDILEEDRISIIFAYLFDQDKAEGKTKAVDLYRYYEQIFAQKNGNVAMSEWSRVLEAFRMIKNWYKDAYLFNTIGLLTRVGVSINDIANIYYRADVNTMANFVGKLNSLLNKKCLPRSEEEVKNNTPEEYHIVRSHSGKFGFGVNEKFLDLSYDRHKDKIRTLLLFLNIRILCDQIEKLRKDDKDYAGHEYRFSFDLFDGETWDVEHIDSAITNQLKTRSVRERWVQYAEAAIKHYYQTEYDDFLTKKTKYESGEIDFETFHSYVIEITEAESDSDEEKNWIGNLTLLNAGINRGYGNALFATKCRKIDEKVNDGAFVPVCTRMVFNKAFPDNEYAARLEWNFSDKKAYHNWMLSIILAFKKKYPLNDEK